MVKIPFQSQKRIKNDQKILNFGVITTSKLIILNTFQGGAPGAPFMSSRVKRVQFLIICSQIIFEIIMCCTNPICKQNHFFGVMYHCTELLTYLIDNPFICLLHQMILHYKVVEGVRLNQKPK